LGSLINSLKYPLQNKKDLIVIGTIFLIAALINLFCIKYLEIDKTNLLILINLIIGFFIFGFLIKIIQYTIHGKNTIPIFYFKKTFPIGVKAIILKSLYFIIPTLIIIIIETLAGTHFNIINRILYMTRRILEDSYNLEGPFNAMYVAYITLNRGLIITPIIGLILFIIFDGMTFMALGKLAETKSLKKALNIKSTYYKLKTYGWKKYTKWYLKFIILTLIFISITALIGLIPYIGFIIISFLLTPYYLMFKYREIGEIYIKKDY
jgi:hypothetical protein